VKHTASKRFWRCFEALPPDIQALARKSYQLLREDPGHPSLHFKLLGGSKMHSVRVGLYYRALGIPQEDGVHWFWIGSHNDYDKLVGQ
jgi:hypothetical protein